MSSGTTTVRDVPCPSCPYRRGVPSGIWSAGQYELLRGYDGDITSQALAGATAVFMCHQSDGKLCAGWAGCHDMRNTLAARVHAELLDPSVFTYESPVPLFASGNEAADHGERDIDDPGEAAREAAAKIVRVREARDNPVTHS